MLLERENQHAPRSFHRGGTIEEHADFPALEALADVSSTESLTEEIERMGPPLQTFLVSSAPVAAGGKVLVLRDLTPVRRDAQALNP